MLAVHFVEHHLDVVPLADFVEAVTWVVVDSTGGSLVGDEGEHGTENVLAGLVATPSSVFGVVPGTFPPAPAAMPTDSSTKPTPESVMMVTVA